MLIVSDQAPAAISVFARCLPRPLLRQVPDDLEDVVRFPGRELAQEGLAWWRYCRFGFPDGIPPHFRLAATDFA